MDEKKLGFGFKVGYSIGYVGMSTLLYIIFFMFFMYFMTDIVGISPIFAGTVSLIAVLWDGISDPVVGYLSDKSKSKRGRRRPFMLTGSMIAAVSIVLLFTKVDFGSALQNAYYLVMAMVFWTALTMFDIPYNAFIAELTDSQSERTTIRSYIMFLAAAAVALVLGLLNTSIEYFTELTSLPEKGWQITVAIIAVFGFILASISWRVSRGREKAFESEIPTENPLVMIKDIFLTKPFKYLVSSSLLIGVINSMLIGMLIYYYTYYLQFDGNQISLMFSIAASAGVLWPVLIAFTCKRLNNDYRVYMITVAISGLSFLLFPIILGVKTMAGVLVFVIVAQLCSAISLWIFGFTFAYENAELDAFLTGKDRTGGFVAYVSFAIKLGTAVGMWVIGLVLEMSGYIPGAAEQPVEVLNSIRNLVSLYPFTLYIIVFILLLLYPLKQKQYNTLKDLIAKKESGQEYSIDLLDKKLV